jgi:type IV secretory pathway VirB2 component (pilin)
MIYHIQCLVLAVAMMMAACQGNDFSSGGNAPAAKAPKKILKMVTRQVTTGIHSNRT